MRQSEQIATEIMIHPQPPYDTQVMIPWGRLGDWRALVRSNPPIERDTPTDHTAPGSTDYIPLLLKEGESTKFTAYVNPEHGSWITPGPPGYKPQVKQRVWYWVRDDKP